MIEVGDAAPKVTAKNQHDELISPDFDEPTVVYFYPKDFTGGCTIEANDFQAALPEFQEADISVYGVSMDNVTSHADFAAEEGITFDLLADPHGEIAAAFDIDTEGGYTDRRTFVLAHDEVVSIYDPELSNPSGHAREVLTDMEQKHVHG